MTAILEQHALLVIIFLFFSLFTSLLNFWKIRRFDEYPAPLDYPRVSILVPARNEAHGIEACIQSLLAQDYQDFEVLVLDDHSTDETRPLLLELAPQDGRLHVLEGKPLPIGWLGKHWACYQLAQAASGDLLLFTDADTYHQPNMLRDSIAALTAERADLVTAFPKEQVISWGEKLIIPVIGWGIFSFLPIPLAQRLSRPGLSVTIGQFMLFQRPAFEAVGGYEAVRQHLVDDVALGRRIIANGFRWVLLDGTAHIHCRMYRGFWEAVDGFTKNVFAFFEYRILLYLIAWLWLAIAFLEPPYALIRWYLGIPLAYFPTNLAVIAVLQSLLLFRIAYRRFRIPGLLVFFYPISLAIFILIGLRSLVFTMTGHATWKGRNMERPAIRWL